MDNRGVIEQCKYKWMLPFLKTMPAALSDKHVKNFLDGHLVHIEVPVIPFDWCLFINEAKVFFKINFMPFLMLACGGISTFHYQQILQKVGKINT